MLVLLSANNVTLGREHRSFNNNISIFGTIWDTLLHSPGKLSVTIRNLPHTLPNVVAKCGMKYESRSELKQLTSSKVYVSISSDSEERPITFSKGECSSVSAVMALSNDFVRVLSARGSVLRYERDFRIKETECAGLLGRLSNLKRRYG